MVSYGYEGSTESKRQEHLDSLERGLEVEKALKKICHGHVFDRDRRCDCGLLERDYINRLVRNSPACPNFNGPDNERSTDIVPQ